MSSSYPDDAMIRFVQVAIEGEDAHATELATRFPFRNRFHHCLRVSQIAGRIARSEDADLEIAAIAGLFHDAGKAAGKDHAVASAELCRRYLESIGYPKEKREIVVDCVRHHSGSIPFDAGAYPRYLAIQRDADILDEIGASGILWTLLAAGEARPDSYYVALRRLTEVHVGIDSEDESSEMRTAAGRTMMSERRRREESFIRSLAEELFVGTVDQWVGESPADESAPKTSAGGDH
jgi:putative nucleotidyltransferase with HDIG domain